MPTETVTSHEIRARARLFAAGHAEYRSEKSQAGTFWRDLLEVFGLRAHDYALFEHAAERFTTGRRGYIDLLIEGKLAVEQKSLGEDLDAAMRQLKDYILSLPIEKRPLMLLVCDFQRFMWEDLATGGSGDFELADLADNIAVLEWLSPGHYRQEWFASQEALSLVATGLLADIYDGLLAAGHPDHDTRIWLTRILFCLFADDTQVWDRAAFHRWIVEATRADGSDLGPMMHHLFQVLNTPLARRPNTLTAELASFPHINGDLFDEIIEVPMCDMRIRDALLQACAFDWKPISPAIFGSMFQNVMDAPERRQLGAHYTTEENILKVIRPLFLDELELELARATSKPRLNAFLERLGRLRFLDPACGCGNFLVIALRELRRIETLAMEQLLAREKQSDQLSVDVGIRATVSVDQFHGIEIEEFPARIARTALYLMDHLCNLEAERLGQSFVTFPIPANANIRHANALRVDWNAGTEDDGFDYVFGNPPFLGHSRTTRDQANDQAAVMAAPEMHDLRTGRLDFVTSWFVKAFEVARTTGAACAFVATNSITQGEQARSMGPALVRFGLHLSFAHRTFAWSSEAEGKAHVHVVIIGFGRHEPVGARPLWRYPQPNGPAVAATAKHLNWYLVDAGHTYPGKHRTPLMADHGKPLQGNKPVDGGHLLVTTDEIVEARRDPIAAPYLRRFVQGTDLLNGTKRWCLWLVDAPPSELRNSPFIRERLAAVATSRRSSRTASVRSAAATPALFTQIRQPTKPFLAMPEVSSERRTYVPMAYLSPTDVVPGNKLLTLEDAPVWLFGYLQSSMFNAWVRAICGRMKSDISIAPDLAYSAFPFPSRDSGVEQRIEAAATAVLTARGQHPGATLSDLYDPLFMPAALVSAHAALDREVAAAFGLRRDPGDDADRVPVLLDRYAALRDGAA